MFEPDYLSRTVIPEHLMLSRLAQSEQMREFFIQMWLQNPVLARQGGSKVQNLLSPLAVANAEEIVPALISPLKMPVAAIEHLIATKTGTGHSKDLTDIEELREIQAERTPR